MRKALLMIVIMMLMGCNDENGGGKSISTTPRISIQPVVASNYYKKHKDPIEVI